MKKIIAICAIAALGSACSTQKEMASISAKKTVQKWLNIMESKRISAGVKADSLYSYLSDKDHYSLDDMACIIAMRQAEKPMSRWHKAKYWHISYDSLHQVYMVMPKLSKVGEWPIAVRVMPGSNTIDIEYSNIEFGCDTVSKINPNDY